jgi:hypothetical protein
MGYLNNPRPAVQTLNKLIGLPQILFGRAAFAPVANRYKWACVGQFSKLSITKISVAS